MQLHEPHWLDEAYSSALTLLDTGAVQRGQITAGLTLAMIRILGLASSSKCLDFGGGHGLFVRMMRDRGFDFLWADKYAENLFARGFEGDPTSSFDLVTSFEVLEHMLDVASDVERLFRPGHRFLLLGTLLHEGYDRDWWYFSNETGQHVSFFSARTMRFLATRYGYSVYVGPQYCLFARNDQSLGPVQRLVLRAVIGRSWLVFGLTSLIPEALRFRFGRSLSKVDSERLEAELRRRHLIEYATRGIQNPSQTSATVGHDST